MSGKDNEWPQAIEGDYDRLAKAKNNRRETAPTADEDDSVDSSEKKEDSIVGGSNSKTKTGSQANDNTPSSSPLYVAIKQITAAQNEEKKYAEREIAILSEINHPNIIKCLRSVEMPRSRLVVLTLADGPDLNELVEVGGALSTSLVRLAARHLISAVAYLHGRGVIHRDIKPDNCILARADTSINTKQSNKDDWMANDAFWDDKAIFDEKEWKIVLADFGFAKALTPAEIGMSNTSRRSSVRNLVQRSIEKQASQQGMENNPASTSQVDSLQKSGSKPKLTRRASTFQRAPIRAMSALGTRGFAAPEVTKARKKSARGLALAHHVADYGLIADAYSIGSTIKVLLTGVPPDQNEMEFISGQNNIMLNILSVLFSCGKSKKDGNGKQQQRKKRYKWLDETPRPARELVRKLMKPVYSERLTVPSARNESWIKGGMSDDDPVVTLPTGDIPVGNDDPIKCLDCAKRL